MPDDYAELVELYRKKVFYPEEGSDPRAWLKHQPRRNIGLILSTHDFQGIRPAEELLRAEISRRNFWRWLYAAFFAAFLSVLATYLAGQVGMG